MTTLLDIRLRYVVRIRVRTSRRSLRAAEAWLNRGLEPSTRATVNSMAGQMDAIGQIAGGPAIGLAAVAWGVPAAIVIAGVLPVPSLTLFARVLRRPLAPPVPVEVGVPEITGMPQPSSEP